MDVTEPLAQIVIVTAAISTVGAALLTPAAVAMGWKWLKAQFF
ncbi:major capsid protein [Agarivorans litoreus]|nr:major capsid protein [Agarivorans litoreus]